VADSETPEPSDTDDLRAILGEGAAPFPAAEARPFMPWHRPRKQYVRNLQWSKEVSNLAGDLGLDSKELRYLTLPGSDLLDIRHLHDTVCVERKLRLKYLGFNTAAQPDDPDQPQLNSTEFSIKRLDFVDSESEVFPGDFRMVGVEHSMSWRRVRRDGHFHAINLDLCGGFAGESKGEGIPNYFRALQWLLANQAGTREDFVLFLTTRMDEPNIPEDARDKLAILAQSIADSCDDYADELVQSWGIDREPGKRVDVTESLKAEEVFMLGLTQWIISQAVEMNFKAKVKSFLTYRIGSGEGEDDLVSIAIRFKPDPTVPNDNLELAQPVVTPTDPADKECEQAQIVPGRVEARTNVDSALLESPDDRQRCLEESKSLLASVGYDPDAFLEWASEFPEAAS